MRFAIIAAFVMTAASLNAFPSSAQEMAACKADKEKFCADMKPGDGKMRECFKQHASELSADCTKAIEAAREARRGVREACKADTEKFCGTVEKTPGAVGKCLESHAAELQEACGAALKSRADAKKG